MTTRITVTLPDNVYKRIQRLAELAGREVDETIATTLDSYVPPLSSELDSRPIETLPDDEVLKIANSMMDSAQSSRMSSLAQKQQAGKINESERAELHMLWEIFEAGQLRKTHGLVEAVRRGLIEPEFS